MEGFCSTGQSPLRAVVPVEEEEEEEEEVNIPRQNIRQPKYEISLRNILTQFLV
jgi:hypothetical protein